MMKKSILLIFIGMTLCFKVSAQDGVFNNLTFNLMEKSGGAADFSGWGLNKNAAFDVRPNSNGGLAFVLNNHNGLTFSAHSNYGGIRFYNQGYPNNPLDPSTGATMVMSINNNAVGIGTIIPRVLLDVGADISNKKLGAVFGRLPEGDNQGEGTFLGVRGYGTTESYERKSFALEHSFYGTVNSSINFFRGGGTEGGFMAFNTSSNIEQMRIDPYGNVGIGTKSPREKLSVNGRIRATEIKVETDGWPDYVFEQGYQNLSLAELEHFIEVNKHLPGIPTAEIIQQEGLELGDMNKRLLKKIEEMTLLLIGLNKKVELQEKEINSLKVK